MLSTRLNLLVASPVLAGLFLRKSPESNPAPCNFSESHIFFIEFQILLACDIFQHFLVLKRYDQTHYGNLVWKTVNRMTNVTVAATASATPQFIRRRLPKFTRTRIEDIRKA